MNCCLWVNVSHNNEMVVEPNDVGMILRVSKVDFQAMGINRRGFRHKNR